jgi:hypothetical protein
MPSLFARPVGACFKTLCTTHFFFCACNILLKSVLYSHTPACLSLSLPSPTHTRNNLRPILQICTAAPRGWFALDMFSFVFNFGQSPL